MKLLIIGGGGQLGSKLIEYGRENHTLYATYMTRRPFLDPEQTFQIDKTQKKSITDLVSKIKPSAVIDTAALHNVDLCETDNAKAFSVNVEGTQNIAEVCNKLGAKMVFISTDYVFDGTKGLYKEEDAPKPINYYGASKLQGEQAVKKTCSNYAIARTSIIYSYLPAKQEQSSSGKPLNFAIWATEKLAKNESLNIVNDQYGSPTLADSLAQTLIKICENNINGLYHIAGRTRLNRYEFTFKLAEKMGYDTTLIKPINSSNLKQTAERPLDSSLNVEKIENTLKTPMLTIDQALAILKSQSMERGD